MCRHASTCQYCHYCTGSESKRAVRERRRQFRILQRLWDANEDDTENANYEGDADENGKESISRKKMSSNNVESWWNQKSEQVKKPSNKKETEYVDYRDGNSSSQNKLDVSSTNTNSNNLDQHQ